MSNIRNTKRKILCSINSIRYRETRCVRYRFLKLLAITNTLAKTLWVKNEILKSSTCDGMMGWTETNDGRSCQRLICTIYRTFRISGTTDPYTVFVCASYFSNQFRSAGRNGKKNLVTSKIPVRTTPPETRYRFRTRLMYEGPLRAVESQRAFSRWWGKRNIIRRCYPYVFKVCDFLYTYKYYLTILIRSWERRSGRLRSRRFVFTCH